jgi:epoxyqueuosine reductase QueG
MNRQDWESLNEEEFQRLFGRTSLSRIKFPDFKRNISDALRSVDYQ